MELCIHVCIAICLANVVNLSLEPEQCLERWLPLSLSVHDTKFQACGLFPINE